MSPLLRALPAGLMTSEATFYAGEQELIFGAMMHVGAAYDPAAAYKGFVERAK